MAGGASLDQTSKDKLVDSLLGSIDTQIPPASYTLNDIKILPDSSPSSLKTYADQLTAIADKYDDPAPSKEMDYFRQMVEQNDESMTKEMARSVATYEGLRKDVLNLAVPADLKTQHLKAVNSLALLKGITEKLKDYSTDPLGALIALKQYTPVATDMANAVKEISDYLKGKGISVTF